MSFCDSRDSRGYPCENPSVFVVRTPTDRAEACGKHLASLVRQMDEPAVVTRRDPVAT